MAKTTIQTIELKENPYYDTKIDYNFNRLINILEKNGYPVILSSLNKYENDTIFIIFDDIYNFYSLPRGFDIQEIGMSDCENPECICRSTPNVVTAIGYPLVYSLYSRAKLYEILQNLTAWVYDEIRYARSGRIEQIAYRELTYA